MSMILRAIRGATTLDADTPAQVRSRTQELIKTLLKENELADEDIVSIIFTATKDITSLFPATAARELGYSDIALLGAVEADVAGAPRRCIRVLVHCYTTRAREDLTHVYLEGAAGLRPDLGR